jgi:hypothetical protein
MGRFLLGVLKGGVIGAGIGYLATQVGLGAGAVGVVVYGAIGAVVGLLCGRPIWRQDTIWTSILKAVFGFALGVGATFAGRKWLGGVHIPLAFVPGASDHALPDVPLLFGAAIGMIYGVFVELDDAAGTTPQKRGTA